MSGSWPFPSSVAFCLAALALLWSTCWCSGADDPTYIEIGDALYGAKADEQGPIGGGAGYTHIITQGDYTVGNLDALLDALANAQAGQVVFIPGSTEIDLTARIYIEELVLIVPAGVTLASDRGHDGSLGALLTSDALKTPVMIRALGPGVRITGLRVQGPCPKRYIDHHKRAFTKGGEGHSYYYKLPTSNGITTEFAQLEVDNCDISGFSHGGVYLMKGDSQHVHHNFIHHCQYQGLGYGVSHGTASSVIEYNLFNYNRHSIASTGRPGNAYVARHNVELGVSLSHCFDMHGGRDRRDGTDVAGTAIEIYNNTFRAPQTPVVIRGVPEEGCDVHHNWFPKHAEAAKAVRASERTHVSDNVYGPEPTEAQ